MKNITKHKRNLGQIIRDTRLNPNRRLLAEMLLLIVDNEGSALGERILGITEKTFGTPSRISYNDPEDEEKVLDTSVADREVKNNMKNVLGSLLESK